MARAQIESIQSNLVAVLNERNRLYKRIEESEKDKNTIADLQNDVKNHKRINDDLKQNGGELMAKLDEACNKLRNEQKKSQAMMLANDKMKADLAEMRARLSSAREEYARLYKANQSLLKEKEMVRFKIISFKKIVL